MLPSSTANLIVQYDARILTATNRLAAQPCVRKDAPRIRFETLDVWRGLAATIVAVFHLVVFSHMSDVALIRHGWISVDFFFVLSGFVITHAFFSDLQEKHRVGFSWSAASADYGPFIQHNQSRMPRTCHECR